MDQPIPDDPINLDHLHTLVLTGKTEKNWILEHEFFIQVWNNWPVRVVSGPPYHDGLHRNSEYMKWYWRHTRRWMHVTRGAAGFAVSMIIRLISYACPIFFLNIILNAHMQYDRAVELRERNQNPSADFENFVDRTCRDIMVALGE